VARLIRMPIARDCARDFVILHFVRTISHFNAFKVEHDFLIVSILILINTIKSTYIKLIFENS